MPRIRSSAQGNTPATRVPAEAELLAAVLQQPQGASLRCVSAQVWPGLPWAPATPGGDSATGRRRQWPAPGAREGAVPARPLPPAPLPEGEGRRAAQFTAAEWLRERLDDLVLRGALRHGDRRRDEVDALASITYCQTDTTLRCLLGLVVREEGLVTTPDLAGRCRLSLEEVDQAARQLAGEGILSTIPLRSRPGLALRPGR